jgi:hypothetical protein
VACDCRVLPLAAVPRAIVNRDTRGVVKLVRPVVQPGRGETVLLRRLTGRAVTEVFLGAS